MRTGVLGAAAAIAVALVSWLFLFGPEFGPEPMEQALALRQEAEEPAAGSPPKAAPDDTEAAEPAAIAAVQDAAPASAAPQPPDSASVSVRTASGSSESEPEGSPPAGQPQPTEPAEAAVLERGDEAAPAEGAQSAEIAPGATDPALEAGVPSEDSAVTAAEEMTKPVVDEAPVEDAAGEDERVAALSPREDAAAEEVEDPDATSSPASEKPTAAAAEASPGAPEFDVVRVAPDGQMVVAGRAEPGSTVEVLIEGEVAGEAEVDSAGGFVAILEAAPSAEPREMRVRVEDRAGTEPGEAAAEDRQRLASSVPGQGAAGAADAPQPRYLTSAPIIILPGGDAAAAPVLVKTAEDDLEVVQPAPLPPGQQIALDRITYESGGDVIAAGRGDEVAVVRTYANGELVAETPVAQSGAWRATIPRDVAADAALLRFDAVSRGGEVISRLEAPFDYSADGARLTVKGRHVTVERGNSLWRLAEQHYGEGLRYSVIFSANAELIRNPDLIYPGQVFTIPELVESE